MNAEFFRPERGLLFGLLFVIVILMMRSHQMRRLFWTLLKTNKSLDRSHAYKAPKNRHLKEILFIIGSLFVILALMRPRWGEKERSKRISGVDLCIAMDLSMSMMAEDLNPNRLSFAKREITLMLEKITDARVTLVGFS